MKHSALFSLILLLFPFDGFTMEPEIALTFTSQTFAMEREAMLSNTSQTRAIRDFFTNNDLLVLDARTLPDGKMLATGMKTCDFYKFPIACFTKNGQPDLTFGTNGTGLIELSKAKFKLAGKIIELLNEKILITAKAEETILDHKGYPVHSLSVFQVRLFQNGSIDTSFGDGGFEQTVPKGMWWY